MKLTPPIDATTTVARKMKPLPRRAAPKNAAAKAKGGASAAIPMGLTIKLPHFTPSKSPSEASSHTSESGSMSPPDSTAATPRIPLSPNKDVSHPRTTPIVKDGEQGSTALVSSSTSRARRKTESAAATAGENVNAWAGRIRNRGQSSTVHRGTPQTIVSTVPPKSKNSKK